jgi:predicted ester cyclase
MDREAAKAMVAPFYDALNLPATKDTTALIESATAPEWRSFSREGVSKSRSEFIRQVAGFGKLMPDLGWEIREVVADDDKIVVRSTASGTPADNFIGVPHGGRSFSILTIDLHTTRDGKLVEVYHVEDWAGAIVQLKG